MTDHPRIPARSQSLPASEAAMTPAAQMIRNDYRGAGKLEGRIARVTGGDSGIGRSVAIHFAREGADVAVAYLSETEDANETKRLVEAEGSRRHLISGDLSDADLCRKTVARTIAYFGGLNVLVNNAGTP